MSIRRHAEAAGILLLWLAIPAAGLAQASSDAPVSPKTNLSIAVAPFERVGRVGSDVPDVAMMLARRLSTMGVERVVSPRELGASPTAEPEAAALVEWAGGAGVQSVVVGRTTALGSRLSIDARLYARDGTPVGSRFFVEAPRVRDLPLAVQDLADQVLAQTSAADLPAVAARPPREAEADADAEAEPAPERAPDAPARAAGPAPRAGFRDDAPIAIRSDVLDVYDRGGQKRFVFRGHVRATQGDLEILSDKLQAFYPSGGSQPHKIVASGNVSLKQSGRFANCEEATFYREDDRIVCTGNIAEVEQGCDVVRGREIIFHTRSEQLKVNGAADVRINSDGACSAEAEG